MSKPVTITLTVHTDGLYTANPQPTTQNGLDQYLTIADDNNGRIPPGQTTIQNFLSQVYDGNTVTWIGANSGIPGWRVSIDSIENNPNFFASDNPGNDGRVTATLNNDIDGVIDTYKIYFSVIPPANVGTPKSYILDPKLKGNPNT